MHRLWSTDEDSIHRLWSTDEDSTHRLWSTDEDSTHRLWSTNEHSITDFGRPMTKRDGFAPDLGNAAPPRKKHDLRPVAELAKLGFPALLRSEILRGNALQMQCQRGARRTDVEHTLVSERRLPDATRCGGAYGI